jgi:hypothetical protein
MITRQVKIKGIAYSTTGNVSITVDYNGTRVFDGIVPTNVVEQFPDEYDPPDCTDSVLGTFDIDIEPTGTIPVVVTVQNGLVFFNQFLMNYVGPKREQHRTDPDVPIDVNIPSSWTSAVLLTTDQHYGEPNINTIESDGLTNARLNGDLLILRTGVLEETKGDWTYVLKSNDVFEFDFFVDPVRTVLPK